MSISSPSLKAAPLKVMALLIFRGLLKRNPPPSCLNALFPLPSFAKETENLLGELLSPSLFLVKA